MSNKTTVFVPGKIYWAKIVGDRQLTSNYEGTGKQWAYDLEPDDVSFLKDAGLIDRLKDGPDDRGPFLSLKKPEVNKDGGKNSPINIYDSEGERWDDRNIGNGSRVVAKLVIMDWGKGKKSSIWTQALRVDELVEYNPDAFAAFDGEGKPAKAAPKKGTSKAKGEDWDNLDDDIPF